jgi:hypothetical protein
MLGAQRKKSTHFQGAFFYLMACNQHIHKLLCGIKLGFQFI